MLTTTLTLAALLVARSGLKNHGEECEPERHHHALAKALHDAERDADVANDFSPRPTA